MTGSSWPHHGHDESSCVITGTWCSGTSSSWGFGSIWEKSKLSPCAEIYFLSMELDLVNVMVHLTNEHAQSVLNCLSSFRSYSLTKAPLARIHLHTAGLWLYVSMCFPQWAFSHRHCARSGGARNTSCWLCLTGPPTPGFTSLCGFYTFKQYR